MLSFGSALGAAVNVRDLQDIAIAVVVVAQRLTSEIFHASQRAKRAKQTTSCRNLRTRLLQREFHA